MASNSSTLGDRLDRPEGSVPNGFTSASNAANAAGFYDETNASGVSWAAVFAGAAVAAAMSLALLALGTGLGLSAVSPWAGDGASASAVGTGSIIYLILMQLVAAGMGGYIAGRLRTKWTGTHDDEVYFRDTAHGFLVWAVGLIITASLLTSAATAMIGGVTKAGAAGVASAASAAVGVASNAATDSGISANGAGKSDVGGIGAYLVDGLFRKSPSNNVSSTAATAGGTSGASSETDSATTRNEAIRIIANGVTDMSAPDKTYLADLIASRTRITPAEAEKRITELQAQIKAKEIAARDAADVARKAAAKLALYIFLGLLISAFCASFAATIGGRQRDKVYA